MERFEFSFLKVSQQGSKPKKSLVEELENIITHCKTLKIEEKLDLLNLLIEKHVESKSLQKIEPTKSMARTVAHFIRSTYSVALKLVRPDVIYTKANKENWESAFIDNAIACVSFYVTLADFSEDEQRKALLIEEGSNILFEGLQIVRLDLEKALHQLPHIKKVEMLIKAFKEYGSDVMAEEAKKAAKKRCDEAKLISDSVALFYKKEVVHSPNTLCTPLSPNNDHIVPTDKLNKAIFEIQKHLNFIEVLFDKYQKFEDCSSIINSKEVAINASKSLIDVFRTLTLWLKDTDLENKEVYVREITTALQSVPAQFLQVINNINNRVTGLCYKMFLCHVGNSILAKGTEVAYLKLNTALKQLPSIEMLETLIEKCRNTSTLQKDYETLKDIINSAQEKITHAQSNDKVLREEMCSLDDFSIKRTPY